MLAVVAGLGTMIGLNAAMALALHVGPASSEHAGVIV